MKPAAYEILRQGDYVHDIGEGAFFPVKTNPTDALYWTLDPDICRTCKARIFANCHSGRLPDGDRRLRLMLAADGSDMAAAPRALALDLAHAMGVTLDVVGVSANDAEAFEVDTRLADIAREGVRRDVACEPVHRRGNDLAREIHDAAARAHTQLLVIGRRLIPLKGNEFGPFAQRLVATAPCHTLIVAPESRLWSRRILVAFDGSDAALQACDFAAQLAKPAHLPITLLSVGDAASAAFAPISDAAQLALARLRADGVEGAHEVRSGRVADALITCAAEGGADLIVLYRHTRGALARTLLGSVSHEVILRAGVPVLLVGAAEQRAAALNG